MSDRFVYVTYIRTTPEKLWDALTQPEFTRKYWYGVTHESEWKRGSPWRMVFADGTVGDSGEVLEAERPWRLVLRWRNEFRPELKAEGFSRATFEIEPAGEVVKLSVVHEMEGEGPKFIAAISNGWPRVLSGLKTLLETGAALPGMP